MEDGCEATGRNVARAVCVKMGYLVWFLGWLVTLVGVSYAIVLSPWLAVLCLVSFGALLWTALLYASDLHTKETNRQTVEGFASVQRIRSGC